jgi:hypothetical protein
MAKKTRLVTSYKASWFFLLTPPVGLEFNPGNNGPIALGTARAPYLGGFIRGGGPNVSRGFGRLGWRRGNGG